MGKHSDPSTSRRAGAVLLVAAAAVLAAGTGIGVAAIRGGDGDASASSGSSVSSSSASAGPGTTLAGHDACVAEVDAQTQLADAVAGSAKHWRTHVQAQIRLDEGVQDGEATAAQWASSKLEGPGDQKAYATATSLVGETSGSCYEAGQADPSAATDDCSKRLDGLKRVTRAGSAVHGEWDSHLRMMKNKHHTEGALYHDRWLGMVDRAEPMLTKYDTAVAALKKAPACT